MDDTAVKWNRFWERRRRVYGEERKIAEEIKRR
jgi:hypothetical protein